MLEQDTICAISTPPGEGGIGIIRISGPKAVPITSKVFKPRNVQPLDRAKTYTLQYGHIVDPKSGEVCDEAIIGIMRSPTSYTREDVVEINCHSGMISLRRILETVIAAGARLAEPGEFTQRAFVNGRIDLAQAEAVLDIITAKTELSHKAALKQLQGGLSTEIASLQDELITLLASVEAGIDFPDEDIETASGTSLADTVACMITEIDKMLSGFAFGQILRNGYATAIVGRPNVGKSSLLNTLLKRDRAIVSEIPGTTRDVLEEYVNSAGIPLRIIDTAGIRHANDTIEQEGVRRSLAALASADLALIVLDGSETMTAEDRRVLEEAKEKNFLIVLNKNDLPRKKFDLDPTWTVVPVSCKNGHGLDDLTNAIADKIFQNTAMHQEQGWMINVRHKTALEQTREHLQHAEASIAAKLSPEFYAADLRSALDNLGLITGATCTEDILKRIFSTFCIGK